MMNNRFLISLLLMATLVKAQYNQARPAGAVAKPIPISKAELGSFPYVKTLPNFKPRNPADSMTIEQNRAYFFDGKAYFSVDGKVSVQTLQVVDNHQKFASQFQLIQTFDQLVATLGGQKIYEGKLPEEPLKKITPLGFVELGSHYQVAPSAYYGVVEYVIKTPQKEVWLQLQPYSIGSYFYTLLVVEKQSSLLASNINKANQLLKELESRGKSIAYVDFVLDKSEWLTESSDEVLALVGVFQAHPDWNLQLEVHSAPVGKPEYILGLTEKRAVALKAALVSLGVSPTRVAAQGFGASKPLVSNETEMDRRTNTRVEVSKR